MGLIEFYNGSGTDHKSRSLEDVMQFNDIDLEDIHDYIQWLFPLPERSAFQPHVPVLTPADIQTFRDSPELQQKLRHSFERILSFYGLQDNGKTVEPAPNYAERVAEWLTPYNHNFLRITRILRSISLLGLEPEAQRFFDRLDKIHNQPGAKDIIDDSHYYWRQQVPPKKKRLNPDLKP